MTARSSKLEKPKLPPENTPKSSEITLPTKNYSNRDKALRILFAVIVFMSGLGSGYLLWGRNGSSQTASSEMDAMVKLINPQKGFEIRAVFGDIGPKLIAAGAIEPKSFELIYQQAGKPLSEKEMGILTNGSQDRLVINQQNSYFLLNLFWALGLTNKNQILDQGSIQEANGGNIEQFASTGGWTIGIKPITEIFSSTSIFSLSPEQQARVEEVANVVFRPCCNNPTSFPDCNHGMAMLGLLELMASQNASTDDMFNAAKQVNAFWYPQQTLEQGLFLKYAKGLNYQNADARMIVGQDYSTASGFSLIHQWLLANGRLAQNSQSGNSCGV